MRSHLACTIVLAGCGPFAERGTSPRGAPDTPIPIAGINTVWDDYNAAKPPQLRELVYSTNRGSEGKQLDVWAVEVSWTAQPGTVTEARPYAPTLMSPADERGPLVLDAETFGNGPAWDSVMIYASAREGGPGGLDLYWGPVGHANPTPNLLAHLSSPANDAYMTAPFAGRRVLFASDREAGRYQLFEATWRHGGLDSPPASIHPVAELASTGDDTAPYVAPGDHGRADLVFASKRPGGTGGYDLWCASFDGVRWGAPAPLAVMNTEHDEFRPSIVTVLDAERTRFLVFSSNRPGGVGGFDLYTTRFTGCPARS